MRIFAFISVSLLPVAFGADSVPEIGATSPVAERRGPVLLYGDHFDDAKLNMATVGSDPKVDRVMKPDELSKSLLRVLSGRAEMPKPKKRLRWRRIEHKERNVAYGWTEELGPHLAYLRNTAGQGEPFVVNRPEVWGLWPRQPRPGGFVKLWGLNLAPRYGAAFFAVVNASDEVVAIGGSYLPYTGHSGRQEANYVRGFVLPEDVSPGAYRLYIWTGLGDMGWSQPYHFEIGQPKQQPANVANVRQYGAQGDSMHDDTEPFRKAVWDVAKKGGGRVFVPPGRYLISDRLDLPPGVELYGTDPDSSVLEANTVKPFPAGYPEKALARPRDLARVKKVTIGGKEYIAGTGAPIDWLPALRGKSCMVWMRTKAAVRNIGFVASHARNLKATIIIGETDGPCVEPSVRNCQFLCTTPYLEQSWNVSTMVTGISIIGSTEDLRIEDNTFKVNSRCVVHLPGYNLGVHVSGNVFTTAEPHQAHTLFMPRAYQQSLIEGNRFEHGGRAKTEQCAYRFPSPARRNCWRANVFFNNRKGDGEILMHEFQGDPSWLGQVGQATTVTVTAADVNRFYRNPDQNGPWPEDHFKGGTVFINAGRGVGQLRTIVSHSGDTLTVDRPWDLVPDSTSRFCIIRHGVIECIFASNDYLFCHYYNGIYGSALRTVWAHEEIESMGGGMYFWAVGAGSLMSLNVAHGLRLHQDAGVLLFVNREVLETKSISRRIKKNYAETYPDWYDAITRMPRAFGNEVRNCYIKDRSVVFTSNSPPPETYRLRKIQRGCDWPIQPLPDRVAGIAIADRYALGRNPHSSATWEVPPNDAFPCTTRWNLLHSNLLLNCPIGIHIGHGIDQTMLSQNTILECRIPIKDDGKATVDTGTLTKHYYQLQAEREGER